MFCKKCGISLEATATICSNCSTKTKAMKYCIKCGDSMPGDAIICGSCNTRAAVLSAPIHWLSLGLFAIGFIVNGLMGGYSYMDDVTITNFISIPLFICGVLSALLTIPGNRLALRVVSIALNLLFVFIVVGFVLSNTG